MTGKPTQTATAQSGVAQLLATGGWSQMDLNGGVKLREAERNGQADHAMFRRDGQTATLTGHAFARDATTETSAPRIVATVRPVPRNLPCATCTAAIPAAVARW